MKIRIHGSTVRAVYADSLLPILQAIGSVQIERATDVEYDHATQQWVATYRATGEVIASGSNRADVIRAEVQFLEREVI